MIFATEPAAFVNVGVVPAPAPAIACLPRLGLSDLGPLVATNELDSGRKPKC